MWDFQFKSIDWRNILFSISFACSSPKSFTLSFLVSSNLFLILFLNSLSLEVTRSCISFSLKLLPTICLTLLSLLIRVDLSNIWSLADPNSSIGEESTIRIGEHLFSDYLLPFELASVLLLMAMIGAIVLARRDVMNKDISTGLPVDQELIEKSSEPLLIKKN